MDLNDFDYPLPKELIAQKPFSERDASRLLVADRKNKTLSDRIFSDITDIIPEGDVLVLNDTKVFPARVIGKKKKTEGKVDLLLLNPYERPSGDSGDEFLSAAEADELAKKKIWKCLVQPALKEGQEIVFGSEGVEALFVKRDRDGIPLVEFKNVDDVLSFAKKIGTMPLPPYIKREADASDREYYQTVFAKNEGAVAAPTAGLHFTHALLRKLRDKGVQILTLTLHVGYGTFKPVDDLLNHKMHSETFELSEMTAEKINNARAMKKKVWVVGTTTLRVLETCVQDRKLVAGRGETDLFIKDPFEFEVTDRLITNFHLPKTTLLLLVSAFMGEEFRRQAYQHAMDQRYRFYSYGDAMVVL